MPLTLDPRWDLYLLKSHEWLLNGTSYKCWGKTHVLYVGQIPYNAFLVRVLFSSTNGQGFRHCTISKSRETVQSVQQDPLCDYS